MLSIPLPADIEERLERLAQATGRSKSDHVREAIIEYLGDLEDAQLAEDRLKELRAGRSDTVPLEDVMKRYGMAD